MRDDCYRFRAVPFYMQQYFRDPPIEDGECDFYWEIEEGAPLTPKST